MSEQGYSPDDEEPNLSGAFDHERHHYEEAHAMPNIDDFYKSQSKYLKAEDLGGRKHKVTIKEVGQSDFKDEGGKKKLALTFEGREKGLILNKTNAQAIGAQHGKDYGLWPGRSINIYPTKVQYGDEMVDAIRVEIPPPPLAEDAFADDKIPF